MCETPTRKSRGSPISSSSSGSQYLDKSGRRRTIYSCTQCSYTSKDNYEALKTHIKKKHSPSASNTADRSKSNRLSPSSASSSTLDCPHPPKRAVRKWYHCSECAFRTPNAKKLKAHLRENHPNTPNSLDSEATKPTTSKQSETKTDEVRLDIDRSDLKRVKRNGINYYMCPGGNCSVRAKDPAYVLRHYQKNHFTLKSEKRTDSVKPKEEMVELSPIASPRLKTRSTDETINSEERDRFFCKLCKFSTLKKPNLRLHEMKHGNNAAYQCKMCSYSVAGSRQLAFHITNHHQEGFPCSLCDFRAESWNSKKRHEATVHKLSTTVKTRTSASEEPSDLDHDLEYACSHCSYKTPSRERFLAHEVFHSLLSLCKILDTNDLYL
jgi:KRAB domain-containing zinc finger protein